MEECMSTTPTLSQENSSECETPKKHHRLWGISYHITLPDGHEYKGVALVSALDAPQAEQVLKANSAFNGYRDAIIVEAIAQVPDVTESGLCVESYTDGTFRKISYGD